MSSVAKRTLTGASLALGVVLLLWLDTQTPAAWSGVVVWAVALALSVLGAWEVGRMHGYRELGLSPALPLAALVVGLPAWLAREELSSPERPWLVLLAGAVLVVLVAGLLAPRARGSAIRFGLWCAVPLYGLVSIDRAWGTDGLWVLVLLSKIGDIFGYFVGRAIGKQHPFPNLSPGKTTAGCVASLVAGALSGLLLGVFGLLPDPQAGAIAGGVSGLLLNVAAQAGDLYESRVKRRGGVKDSSTLVGAAGGVLDVVDSLLFTIPVTLVVWPIVFS